ncbi:DUF1671-domain-containing protein [Russula earlei]|uniref:DUF1671-domain-containing protein n=1 Tax=Russula earlei TaxID=71964 RepID=A0ACC0TXB5_9AGAM|nr:DUF1671-domain-containing protein [Russula earlei]
MSTPNQDAILVHDSEDEALQTPASPSSRAHSEPLLCLFCSVDLIGLTPENRQTHYDNHLSALESLPPPSSDSPSLYLPLNANRSPTKGIISFIKPSAKERFWCHSLGGEPPHNYTPGLIPLLRKTLLSTVESGATRRAVLCYEHSVHIYHEIWDAGWGCGYRNFMMLCTALVDQRTKPGYSSLLRNPTPPTVNNLKLWIEEAWKDGFDPEGAQGLKGKLVGHKKWIGTAELYVAFTYKGIPITKRHFRLTDVAPLLDWIKRYFDAHTPDLPTSVQERWQMATPVVITDCMPLILQHQGHSRTIVGYELAKDGSTILLAFDPSIRVTKMDGIAPSSSFRAHDDQRGDCDTPCTSKRPATESPKKGPRWPREKRAGLPAAGQGASSPKRARAGSPGVDVIVVEDSRAVTASPPPKLAPEPRTGGLVAVVEREAREARKVGGDKRKSDSKGIYFGSVSQESRKKDKYQVLWCPMGDPLSESDKQARREVFSEHIC